MELNDLQKKAITCALRGKNVFITGSAGTGKSLVIRLLYKHLQIATLCSTTGIGATIIGGQTLHSALCIGLGKDTAEKMILNPRTVAAFAKLQILIIDEISMLSDSLFDKLNAVAKIAKKNDNPFGGIQLIVSGDFLQLPPVEGQFIFKSKSWNEMNFENIELKTIMRQNQPEFIEHLQNLRIGVVSDETRAFFEQRLLTQELKEEIKKGRIYPTIIYSHKSDAERYNDLQLKKLQQEKTYEYTCKYYDSKGRAINIKKELQVPHKLTLCEKAQIILVANLDVQRGLVNGSRGFISSFKDGLPVVTFSNNITMQIKPYTWEVKKNNQLEFTYRHIPIILGWAITIHKSQGMTLDYAALDVSRCFEDGQVYVAMSRARSLESLYILNINWSKVRASESAIEFYKNI